MPTHVVLNLKNKNNCFIYFNNLPSRMLYMRHNNTI